MEIKGLLLEDRWAPVTSELGFLEARAEHAARAFASWQAGMDASCGITVQVRPISGSLEQVLSALPPLTRVECQRYLFIPTRSSWTAYLDNGWAGTDTRRQIPAMAQNLGCRGIRVRAVPHTLRNEKGRQGTVLLGVFGLEPQPTFYSAWNEGERWRSSQHGEPLHRDKRDDFTFDMLKEHLHHLGLAPFEESFYLPAGEPAWLVERTGPVPLIDEERTLAQAREDL